MKARILIADIETSPMLAAVWRLWKTNVGINMIKDDWYILSFAAKWLDKDRVIYKDITDHKGFSPTRPEDDHHLLQTLHSLLSEADIVVAHNGKRFDVRKINARFIKAGFPPVQNYKVVDTLIESRKLFDFPSHSLQYLTEHLLVEQYHKRKSSKFQGFELWAECMQGNAEAWEEMQAYNEQDIAALEALYLKMRPWIIGHPNIGNYEEDIKSPACPKCGSHSVVKRGTYHTSVQKYQRYRCKDCGGWSRGRYTISNKETRHNLLVN